jgi:hypothetical protein
LEQDKTLHFGWHEGFQQWQEETNEMDTANGNNQKLRE